MHASPLDYETVLETVREWPAERRFLLVQDVLKTLAPPQESSRPRATTLHKALGLAATDQPPPTDEEVEQWLDERRMSL